MNFVRPLFTRSIGISKCLCQITRKNFSSSKCLEFRITPKILKQDDPNIHSKYQIFKNESEVVLDVYDEDRNLQYGYDLPGNEEEETDRYEGLNLIRGTSGVFDIEDLVDVLQRENALDILVAKIPKGYNYSDFICIVTVKSTRHMHAVCQFVRRVFKMKRGENDLIPKLEGANSKDWQALDLGNIALHVFSKEARVKYDLDSLWAVGAEMDLECNKKDPLVEMLEKNTYYLSDLKPAN